MKLEKELFRKAFYWTSFSPEKRGDSLHAEMSAMLESDLANLGDKAGNYAEKFEQRLAIYLHRKSRVASSMIAGPANFPVAANAKKMDAEMKAWKNLMTLRSKWLNAAYRVPVKTPEEEVDEALARLDKLTTIRELLKACNKLKTKEARAEFIKENTSGLEGYKGFHLLFDDDTLKTNHYTLPYLTRAVKECETKLTVMRARIERKANFEPIKFPGGLITIEEDRVMIKHDDKPAPAVIDACKARGFRWSPNWKAWVRKHTARALYDAQNLVKVAA